MKRIIYILIIGMWMLLFSFCGGGQDGNIEAPGIVDGEIVTLKSQVTGTLDAVPAKEGGVIAKDALVAQVNSDKLENRMRELAISLEEIENETAKLNKKAGYMRSNLAYLGKQVKRFQRLNKNKSIAGERLETMELRKKEAETALFEISRNLRALELRRDKIENKREYLQLQLADHAIKSPVERGVVIETFVSKGETVMPGTSILDILDTGSLYVEVFLEEPEIAKLKLNMTVDILVDGIDKPLTGTVSYFGRKAEFSPKYIISEKERKSLLYEVKVKVEGESGVFKVGMPVTVVFEGTPAASK